MAALLDVNVLIALLDADHTLHARAIAWFSASAPKGWASCPTTENGCVRIMSHPSYPNVVPVSAVIERLAKASAAAFHEFWADDISLLDADIAIANRIHGPRQLTDLYLLALAVRHDGEFVTFDGTVSLGAIRGAEARHIRTL